MNTDEIKKICKDIFEKYLCQSISYTKSFEEKEMDEIDRLLIFMELENVFLVDVPDVTFTSIQQISDFIEERLSRKKS